MSDTDPLASLAPGAISVTPHLVIDGAAEAIEFYERAFDAIELMRLPGPDGRIMHACVSINGSPVMLVDQNLEYDMKGPKALGGSPVTLHLNVADADAAAAKAEAAGATIAMAVSEQFWGDRYGVVVDPYGHQWAVATPRPGGPATNEELAEAMERATPM